MGIFTNCKDCVDEIWMRGYEFGHREAKRYVDTKLKAQIRLLRLQRGCNGCRSLEEDGSCTRGRTYYCLYNNFNKWSKS